MIRNIVTSLLVISLAGCSMLADKAFDFLKGGDSGINVDAQIGDTDSKVKTGVGRVGDSATNETTIKDSDNVSVDSSSGKYHLKSDKEVTVNVYETNRWLYAIFAIWLLGKPALRWWANLQERKTKTSRPR
jgi:hypothetical protein